MYKNYGSQHVFMVLAFGMALFTPLLLLLVPSTVADLLYFERSNWIIYLSGNIYLTYGIGFGFIILAFLLLCIFKVRIWSVIGSVVFVASSFWLIYSASQGYIIMNDTTIFIKEVFQQEERSYTWNDVEQLNYYDYPPEENETDRYELFFQDGEMIEFKQNGYVEAIHSRIFDKVRASNKEVNYIEE